MAVELLVAAQYLNPEPYLPSHTPQLGFLRFLDYFAREYWTTDPVIVNFNDEMSRKCNRALKKYKLRQISSYYKDNLWTLK